MVYFVSIFVYLILLAIIGIVKSRQVKNQDDFAIAGRTLSPWIMVCTMLAVWIGTGSIVGNAEITYKTGMAVLIIPISVFIGMILLSMIATRARNIEAGSVPEIIGGRFGQVARALAMISLIIAYMVIVSYQFNAGGAVLEVITGNKEPVPLKVGDVVTGNQLKKKRVVFTSERDQQGSFEFGFVAERIAVNEAGQVSMGSSTLHVSCRVDVVPSEQIKEAKALAEKGQNRFAIKQGHYVRIVPVTDLKKKDRYAITEAPKEGRFELVEPILTAQMATIIATCFIIAYTMLAGLMSLAYADIVTGTVITLTLLITFPIYWFKAGGWSGMEAAYLAMGDHPNHMQLWEVFTKTQLINYCLPVFLLILGDANQYQRIFASRSAKGAKSAVITMIFVATVIEMLIIACAWIVASMTPDPENGKYILIYAARHYLPLPLGCLFMVTVVGIIISTADSFLLVPSTTFIKDVYLNYINPKAKEKHILFVSRLMVLVFGIIAYLVSLAFSESTGFFEKALYAFTIYGASITPSLIAALVWPQATKAGAIASILSGTAVALLWSEADFIHELLPRAVSDLDAVLPAITISVICLIVVSLLTKKEKSAGGDS
ncbi:MAG: sodium:solute symporter family protein [Planctomycetota bacterium]|jgi:Na+/proline symporter